MGDESFQGPGALACFLAGGAFSNCDGFIAFFCDPAAAEGGSESSMTSSLRFDSWARAAMLGLCASQSVACGSADPDTNNSGTGGSDASTSASTSSDSGSSEGGSAEPMGILSTKVIADLTLEQFSEECQEAGGVVETHSHCGGANTCKGFSYDSDTDVYSVHTCRGYNTCTGFSCVVPDA